MNAATAFPPQILTLFRGMDDFNRHRVLQLLVREFPYAEQEADIFLAAASTELHPSREDLQDALYPTGFNMEASRLHRIELEKSVATAERYAAGRSAMLCAPLDRIAAERRS